MPIPCHYPAHSHCGIGNDVDLRHQNEVGDCEFKWARQYGSAWRQRGCLGVRASFLDILPRFSE